MITLNSKTLFVGLLATSLIFPGIGQPLTVSASIVTEQESIFAEVNSLSYQSFESFQKAVKAGKPAQEVSCPVKNTSDIYTLASDIKISGKKQKLKEIQCDDRSVLYIYDNDITFCYYPNYQSDEGLLTSYQWLQKDHLYKKKTKKYTIYVTDVTMMDPDSPAFYQYTWVQDGCRFDLQLPQSLGIKYGFSMCKIAEEKKQSQSSKVESQGKKTIYRLGIL